MPKRGDGAYNLRKIFEQMELELVQNLRRNLKRHEKEEEKEGFRWEMWQRAKLRNLRKFRQGNKKIVDGYSEEVDRIIQETLHEEFSRAESFVSRMFEKIRNFFSKRGIRFPHSISSRRQSAAPPTEKDFFGANKKKLEALQEEAEKGEKEDDIQPEDVPEKQQQEEKSGGIKKPEESYHPEGKEKELTGHTNDAKLDSMIEQVTHDLKEAQKAVWRSMDDIYRRTIYKAEMNMAAGAKTLDQAIDMATKEFLEAGINCIEYRNGRRVNIASYAEMALRTASQRATLLAEGKKRDEWGIHTVVVTAHANTCPLCAPWQGKVLVDDVYCHGTAEEAKELGVPLLSSAMKAGLLHPNCRHTLSTYFPGITRLPTVPDTKKAIETYRAEQEQRALERKIRKWKRIAEGSMEPEKVNAANDRANQYQKELRDYLKAHPELRRDYSREKIRGIPAKPSHSARDLTLEEKGAVVRYVSPDSYALNDKLRRNEPLTEFEKEWIMNLNSALDKLPKYKGNLNRSLYFSDIALAHKFFDGLKQEVTFPQYLSATKTGTYNPEAQVQIYIQDSKKGRDLNGLNDMEEEVLYPTDAKFRVVNKVKQADKFYILLEEVE